MKTDRRILKSQEAIKRALVELMLEKKFDRITIQDIADRANVSRRTIYLHYEDKYDLLEQLIKGHMEELKRICEAENLTFKDTNLLWFKYFEENFDFFSTMLASDGATIFRSRFLEFVIQETNKHNITNRENHSIEQEAFVHFMGSASVGLVEWWIRNNIPLSPLHMAEQVGIYLNSFCSLKY
ncbi:TetR/AcrR family transcriptional regulator [Terribacillus saccharophilus]|uniref:TetR/AcrR family transcriptional regulator n=1 Tax=Terribacillus saccharophilus TaxID=361277 RepID=UPI003981E4B6